mgnify:CR=1 FL=1
MGGFTSGQADSVAATPLSQRDDYLRGQLDLSSVTDENVNVGPRHHPGRQNPVDYNIHNAGRIYGSPPSLSQAAINRKQGFYNKRGTAALFNTDAIFKTGHQLTDSRGNFAVSLFGKVLKPYKKYLRRATPGGIWYNTRFGIRKLHRNPVGLYIKADRKKFYLHRW